MAKGIQMAKAVVRQDEAHPSEEEWVQIDWLDDVAPEGWKPEAPEE